MLWVLCWMKGTHAKEEKLTLSCVARGWFKTSQHCTIFYVKWSCFTLDAHKSSNQKKTFLQANVLTFKAWALWSQALAAFLGLRGECFHVHPELDVQQIHCCQSNMSHTQPLASRGNKPSTIPEKTKESKYPVTQPVLSGLGRSPLLGFPSHKPSAAFLVPACLTMSLAVGERQ